MAIKASRRVAAVAMALAVATACSNPVADVEIGDGAEFSFTAAPGQMYLGPVQKLTVTVPDQLQQIARDEYREDQTYLDNKVLDEAVMTAVPTQSARNCAVRTTLSYSADDVIGRIDRARFGTGLPNDSEPTLEEKVADAVAASGSSDPVHVGEPDLGDPELGVYFSPDFSEMTQVVRCATTPTAQSSNTFLQTIAFSYLKYSSDGRTQASSLAKAGILVMKNGDLYVVKSNVQNYAVDVNGTWVETG